MLWSVLLFLLGTASIIIGGDEGLRNFSVGLALLLLAVSLKEIAFPGKPRARFGKKVEKEAKRQAEIELRKKELLAEMEASQQP